MVRHLRRHGLALVVSLAATLLLTWPLIRQAGLALPFATGDGLENAWNIWWAKEALVARRVTPFWGATLYQPHGTSLLFHALGLAAAPLAIPLEFVVDPPTALVLTLLGLLWLTALTSYFLIWDIVHHRGAALVGGLFVALAPAHLYHLHMGQLNLTALYPVPLVLLAARRAARRRQWRWVAVGAVSVVVCALADWQYLVLATLATGVLLALEGGRRWRRPRAAGAVLVWGGLPLVMGLAILSPLVLAMLLDLRNGDAYAARPAWQAERRSVDLGALLAPNPFHPLWGAAAWEFYERAYPLTDRDGTQLPGRPTLVNVNVGSLSLVALALAGMAAWRRRGPWPWLVVLALAVVMALGPELHINGASGEIALPYALFWRLPYMDIGRTPAVFIKVALLALGVLLALGLRRQVARLGRRRLGSLALLGLSGLLLFENLAVPLRLPTRPLVSACYRVLAADPRPGAVLDLPVINADEPMYFQTIHRRPIFGGDLSRDNPYPFLFETPVIAQVIEGQRAAPVDILLGADATGAETRAILAGWGVEWLIYRPRDAEGERPRFDAMLQRVMAGVRPVCTDETATLWRLERAPVALALGDGWHGLEQDREVGAFRWLEHAAEVTVFAPAAGPVELTLTAWAHEHDRALQVWIDDWPRGTTLVPVGRRAPLRLRLEVPAGLSRLVLRATDPASRGGPTDERQLAVAVAGLRVGACCAEAS